MFTRVAPQIVEHTDGYSVASKGRETLLYKDQNGEVTIYIDAGPAAVAIYPKTMKRFTSDGKAVDMTPEEKAVVLPRFVDGWAAMSERPVMIEQ